MSVGGTLWLIQRKKKRICLYIWKRKKASHGLKGGRVSLGLVEVPRVTVASVVGLWEKPQTKWIYMQIHHMQTVLAWIWLWMADIRERRSGSGHVWNILFGSVLSSWALFRCICCCCTDLLLFSQQLKYCIWWTQLSHDEFSSTKICEFTSCVPYWIPVRKFKGTSWKNKFSNQLNANRHMDYIFYMYVRFLIQPLRNIVFWIICVHHTINQFHLASLEFKYSYFSGCTSGGHVRFSVESRHSLTPVTQSSLLLDTFQKKRYLIVGPIFVSLPLSLSFYWSFSLIFFNFDCVCACLHVCKSAYVCPCGWLVISLTY